MSAAPLDVTAPRPDVALLRTVVIAAGLCWSVLFVVVGLVYQLQMYADGSIFSYAVAVQDAWAFHWRNISGRLFVYLFSSLPAESYVALTGDAHGSVFLYGLLQFAAPLLGLAATYAADRSPGRIIFATACASTALLCPLVFGFPTELWMSHAVFWPALAICHYPRGGITGLALVFVALLALVLTHGGGLIFALAILATLLLRGARDTIFRRTGCALLAALVVWGIVKRTIRPDEYFGSIVVTAALMLINPANLASDAFLVLLAALAAYGIAFLALRQVSPSLAHASAAGLVAVVLAGYWLWFDHSLHADDRYALRMVLLFGTPALGMLAAVYALRAEGRLMLPVPFLPHIMAALTRTVPIRAAVGAIALVMLVHAVETAKFVNAWTGYKAAVRALAMGTAADPALGDARFVSSHRIGNRLNRLSWFSTTPYLSALLAPGFAPNRLVIDPENPYFWLSCATATANAEADRAVPVETRSLVRTYSCLHRQS
jgi:hypothetical protein